MELCLAVIFLRKKVLYNGLMYNVYKPVDIDVGLCSTNDSISIFTRLSDRSPFYVLDGITREKVGNDFNTYDFYAATIGFDFFINNYYKKGETFDSAKNKNLDEISGYYVLGVGKGIQLNIIKDKIFLMECDKVFGKNSSFKKTNELLSNFGEFLTDKNYKYNPAICREKEIEEIQLALITPDKSAILVGEAGVGKTAIVEGLAYMINNDLVPERLRNYEIISINTSTLISGCQYVGMVEERVNKIINELKNNKNIIMFIDEIHTVIGAGAGSKSNLDVANILKPHLDRGDIKIIGSTTNDEYNNLILDPAFKRRFKKIKVSEPEEDVLLEILKGTVDWLEQYYSVKFNFSDEQKNIIFSHLLDVTSKNCRDNFDKINNPDLVLSILKEAFAIASLYSHEELLLDDIIKAIKNEDRIYKSSSERISLKLIKVFTNNINSEKKLKKVIELPFSEN